MYFFVQVTLPFGLCTACAEFERVAGAVQFVAQKRGISNLWRYLDDFFIVHKCKQGAQHDLTSLVSICTGFEIAENKLCPPTHQLKLMGLEIDSVSQTVRITNKRQHELITLISSFLSKPTTTVRELQSLTGRLNLASRAVRPGRTFLRLLYSLILSSPNSQPNTLLKTTRTVRSDLHWWLYLLRHWNGVSVFPSSH